MTNQKLAILALVAAAFVGIAVMLNSTANGPQEERVGSSYLIQGLDPAQIAKIVVEKGDEPVTLVRKDDGQGFQIVEKSNYSADNKQINDLLTKLMDIQTTELVSKSQDNHGDLGVTEEAARDVVKFFKADGTLITGVIVGNAKDGGSGTYIRRINDPEHRVYLTSNAPYIRKRALDYMDQTLVTLKKDDIVSVQVKLPDAEYSITSDPNEGIEVTPVPEGRLPKISEARSVLNALTGLRCNDVQRKTATDLAFDHQYQCKLKDSTVYTLKIAKQDGKTYVNCTSEYTDKTKVTIQPGVQESEEQLKAKEAKLLAQEKALKFSQRHSPWVYEIPDYKAKYFVKPLDDLLEEPEPEDQDTGITNLVPDLTTEG